MGTEEIQALLKSCLAAGRFSLTVHAIERQGLRLVTKADIQSVGRTGLVARDGEEWIVSGTDTDHDALTVVCSIDVDTGIWIVTVKRP